MKQKTEEQQDDQEMTGIIRSFDARVFNLLYPFKSKGHGIICKVGFKLVLLVFGG